MSRGKSRWMQCGVLGAVCVLVIGLYAYVAHSGYLESVSLNAADTYYNLLVQGFRAGQLSLKTEAPSGLAQLADPYDPAANTLYRFIDLSYYKGKLYLYFGVTPALILFWPFVALTGHYLLHRQAVVIFCAIGFLVSVGLLCALWRRHFAEVGIGVLAACVLALGLATGVPILLSRSEVYEVPISCGYMLTMLALGAVWCALHEPERRLRWLAAASVAYGLAVGARPSLLFGALILLLPVVQAWREHRKIWPLLLAASGPMILIGLGLMLYNQLRFGNPFEFGLRYQLTDKRQLTRRFFDLHHLWFNFRVYFLEPVRWSVRSPYVNGIVVPPLPPGHGNVEKPFGILTNIPLVWLTLAVPLAWRGRSAEASSILRWFVMVVALLFWIGALTLGLYYCACSRFQVEFLPAMVLLAVVGILGMERALAEQPVCRLAARWGWGLLLVFSVAFNLFAGVENYAEAHCYAGNALMRAGKPQEGIGQFEQALRIMPDLAEAHNQLGLALERVGKHEDAIWHYEQALRIMPDFAAAHDNLGGVLLRAGRVQEAIAHYEQALRIMPDYPAAYNLGLALEHVGKLDDAIAHYEQALRIKPDFAEAHNNLGGVLWRAGRIQEAIGQFEQALRIKSDFAEAHNNLGFVLWRVGRIQEAIGQFEQALRIKSDFAEAHNSLGAALQQAGKLQEAIGHYEQALRIKPDYAEAHYNLGVALEQAGRVQEAIGHYEQALRIKPDLAEAQNRLAQLRAVQ